MAITKTIQATVKNRTDTAANWTQKNPVLAEGEIIVVQTSAGETRLKIGDGVKTFTQLPYIDEQIYNNVVTSVNGQTGDVILPGDFIVNVTSTDDINCTLDKTFDQIQEAVQAGKKVYAKLNGVFTIYMPMVLYSSFVLIFAATAFTSESIEQYVLAVPMSNSDGNNPQFLKKLAVTYNSDPTTGEKTMPQVDMSEDPVSNMQIATKKYVDDSLWYGADMEMSDTSTHPVRNMVIKKYVDDHVAGSQSLGLKSAAVGQIAKITAVDASGTPTAWEPADMPSGGSSDVYVDFWPTGSEQYNGNYNGYQIELATDQTFDAIFDSFKAGNKIVARLYENESKDGSPTSSVNASVTGTKEFGAIYFQFVTANFVTTNADTGAIAGFPFIGEAIMMIKMEEASASYLIENRNVLPTPNADGTDNGKVPIINGTKWELKTPEAGGSPDAVLYTSQTLTDAQKKQARDNLDAASYFVVNGTMGSDGTVTLNKTFGQIQAAIQEGKRPAIKVTNNGSDLFMTLVTASEGSFLFASEALTFNHRVSVYKIELNSTGVANFAQTVMPTFNTDGQLRQYSMDAEPALDRQIATKKYVDDKISDKEIILSSSTAGSTKKFKLTIDDTGTLTASEITA